MKQPENLRKNQTLSFLMEPMQTLWEKDFTHVQQFNDKVQFLEAIGIMRHVHVRVFLLW